MDQQTGGIVRITTDVDDNDDWYIDWGDIRSLLVLKRISFEDRLKLLRTTGSQVDFGIEADYNNRVEFHYNVANGDTTWQILCRDGGATTKLDSGINLDTSYHIFRIQSEIEGGSHIHFYIDPPTECGNSPITTNVPDDAADYLQPFIQPTAKSGGGAMSLDVDYVAVRQDR